MPSLTSEVPPTQVIAAAWAPPASNAPNATTVAFLVKERPTPRYVPFRALAGFCERAGNNFDGITSPMLINIKKNDVTYRDKFV